MVILSLRRRLCRLRTAGGAFAQSRIVLSCEHRHECLMLRINDSSAKRISSVPRRPQCLQPGVSNSFGTLFVLFPENPITTNLIARMAHQGFAPTSGATLASGFARRGDDDDEPTEANFLGYIPNFASITVFISE